jgi:S-DNA-T family DNA segregation ATPase FtsK/SpoIIIE
MRDPKGNIIFRSSLMRWYKRHPELSGIALILVSIIVIISLIGFDYAAPRANPLGLFGWGLAFCIQLAFGAAAIATAALTLWIGVRLTFSYEYTGKRYAAIGVALFSGLLMLTLIGEAMPRAASSFFSYFGFASPLPLGGFPVFLLQQKIPYINLEAIFGTAGSWLLAVALGILSLGYLFEKELLAAVGMLHQAFIDWKKPRKVTLKMPPVEPCSFEEVIDQEKQSARLPSLLSRSLELSPPFVNIPEPLAAKIKEELAPKQHPPEKKSRATDYSLPDSSLLRNPKKVESAALVKELKHKAELLEETLLSFGIEAKVGQIYSGPTITSFEVHPAIGVKVGKIKTLEHDIALNLEAQSIRIIAPIPGKACVGIEVPNKFPQHVAFKEVLSAYSQGKSFKIPMFFGKTVSGEFIMHDLTKMPHLLIAGATGAGKSVCIHSLIMSILMTSSPDQVRLLMIDPKKVELTPYSELPHMISPVITDPRIAAQAFGWIVKEMERRYEYLRLIGVRNIETFNERKRDASFEQGLEIEIPEKLPYFVVIVDELADLMMSAEQDVETPIARIAQMARAVGIHLILATQRPSREIITGLIKANFPARIAFKVASRVNSQIILDDIGAETLLGNGDMLFLAPGYAQLLRIQGAFIHEEEIADVIEAISKQLPPNYLIPSFDRIAEAQSDEGESMANDVLFEEAKSIVLTTGNASTTFLQRKLKIGYARAASLMDELERKGIVGPADGAKPRKIFYPKESML